MAQQQKKADDGSVEFIASHPFALAGVNDGRDLVPGQTYRARRELVRRIVDAGHGQAVGEGMQPNHEVFALKPGQKVTAFGAPGELQAVTRGAAGGQVSDGAEAFVVGETEVPAARPDQS